MTKIILIFCFSVLYNISVVESCENINFSKIMHQTNEMKQKKNSEVKQTECTH